MRTLYAFGDSMLDCAHYTADHVTPSTLLCENRDDLFPEFKGMDLASLGPWQLAHRARDGATLSHLEAQFPRKPPHARSCAVLTIGGNDLLQGLLVDKLASDDPSVWDPWFAEYERILERCPVRPLFVGNVYDPTFGDAILEREFAEDGQGERLRSALRMFNEQLALSAARVDATLIDLHARFQSGDPSWVTQLIEPSSRGASEIRAAFLPSVLRWARQGG